MVNNTPLKLNRLTLAFDGSMETDFRACYNRESLAGIKRGLVFGIVLYAVLGSLDWVFLPQAAVPVSAARFLFVLPQLIFLIFAAHVLKAGRWLQPVVFVSFVALGCGMIHMVTLGSAPAWFLNHAGLILVLMWGYLLIRARFLWAAAAGLILMALYEVSALFLSQTPDNILAVNTALLIIGNGMGMAACYGMEHHARLCFFHQAAAADASRKFEENLDESHGEIIRANRSLELELLAHTEAEAKLKESEEKYRTLIDKFPDGIGIVQDKTIVFANPGLGRITGYKPEEMIGSSMIKGVGSKAPPRELEPYIIRMETTSDSPPLSTWWTRKDGVIIHIELSGTLIQYNNRPATLFVMKDVTEDVQAQKERGLLKRKLEKARKMEAMGLLAGGVAHDLNNILSGIVSLPGLLLTDLPEKSDLREPIEMIKDSGIRASIIVDELLTLGRGSAKDLMPVNLNEVINNYLRSPEFGILKEFNQKVIVETLLAPDLSMISATKVDIRKVVMNLVANGAESIKKEGRLIIKTVNCCFMADRPKDYISPESGDYVCLSISDTGEGIDPEDIDRIFEPFYTKKVLGKSGTGLGLAIVWNTVHDHNGYIDVKSDNAGTCFSLFFPASTSSPMEIPEKVMTLKDYSGQGERLLVVDDCRHQRVIESNMLERLGYSVKTVSSGKEAIQYLQKEPVDLVLLDMIMAPGMSGLETYRELLKIDPTLSCVIVSGFSHTDDVEKTQELGAGAFLKKPFPLERLGMAVKKELNKKEK